MGQARPGEIYSFRILGAVDECLRSSGREPAQFLFPGRGGPDRKV